VNARLLVLPPLAALVTACASRPVTGATAPVGAAAHAVAGVGDRALRLYQGAIVVDTHNDLPTKILDEGYDPDVRHTPGIGDGHGETDLPRLMESGLTAVFLSAWVDAPYARMAPGQAFQRALRCTDSIHAFVDRHPDRLRFATTAADVRRAKAEGKVAIFIGVEGGHAIENSLEKLRELHRRGVRYMTLTWNNGNDWAGSSIGEGNTRTAGLTDFGRQVVHEMNRLGVLVDVSHVSEATFYDAVAASAAPVIASHSSARALNDHPRNLTDDQLRAIARNGGVVDVNFYSAFLDSTFMHARDRVMAEARQEARAAGAQPGADSAAIRTALERTIATRVAALPRTPLRVLLDHVDHIARVAGVDHVGIGSDFDGVGGLLPQDMDDVTALPRIAQGLLDRGYSEADVRKMLGGNMLRVMEAVLR